MNSGIVALGVLIMALGLIYYGQLTAVQIPNTAMLALIGLVTILIGLAIPRGHDDKELPPRPPS